MLNFKQGIDTKRHLEIDYITYKSTVKLGDKERFDKEQIGARELFTDYQPFYTINLLLNKELLPIQKIQQLGVSEHQIVKIRKKRGLQKKF